MTSRRFNYHTIANIPPLESLRVLGIILGYKVSYLQEVATNIDSHYSHFSIPKGIKAGRQTFRCIEPPDNTLKAIQRCILDEILKTAPIPEGMIGGVEGKSIADSARQHINKPILVTMDLKSCFPRTSHNKVFDMYRRVFHCSTDTAYLLTRLTTKDMHLPQGAPTSPMLANLTLLPLYYDIQALLEPYRVVWTFFVDDIAMSGTNVREFISPIIDLITQHGHGVSHRKLRIMPNQSQQIHLGLSVNRKIAVTKQYTEDARQRLFELSTQREVGGQELRSIQGRIRFVKQYCPTRGASLEALYNRLFPMEHM